MLVKRPKTFKMRYQDIRGREHEIEVNDSAIGRILHHEADHVKGILMDERSVDSFTYLQLEDEEEGKQFRLQNQEYLSLFSL